MLHFNFLAFFRSRKNIRQLTVELSRIALKPGSISVASSSPVYVPRREVLGRIAGSFPEQRRAGNQAYFVKFLDLNRKSLYTMHISIHFLVCFDVI